MPGLKEKLEQVRELAGLAGRRFSGGMKIGEAFRQIHALTGPPLPESRPQRLARVMGQLSEARSEVESLAMEMAGWHDNLPEGLDSTNTADMLDEAGAALSEAASSLEGVEMELEGVEFPRMFGG